VATSVQGRFIVFEGSDGAGTTTQSRAAVQALTELGRAALYTREPSDGPVGAFIRSILRGQVGERVSERTLAALFAADRRDHLDRVIEPALRRGVDVISDRYVLSSLAYQGVMTGEPEWVEAINAGVRGPDLTVLLDVPTDVAARRRSQREGPTERYEVDATQQEVAVVYRRLAREAGALVLDGTRDRAEVTADVLAALAEVGP